MESVLSSVNVLCREILLAAAVNMQPLRRGVPVSHPLQVPSNVHINEPADLSLFSKIRYLLTVYA